MSNKDFADRISRLEAKTGGKRSYARRTKPQKKRWLRWVLAICVVAALWFSLPQLMQPKPTFADVFSGDSRSAFDGELETVAYRNHGFQIDIPMDWRERTAAEKEEHRSSRGGEDTTVIKLADLTAASAVDGSNIYMTIGTFYAGEMDALTYLTEFNKLWGLVNILGWLFDFQTTILRDAASVDHLSLPTAESVLVATEDNEAIMTMTRTYKLDSDIIIINVIWEDAAIHPAAFAPILDSLIASE